jgi:hypothetical protein
MISLCFAQLPYASGWQSGKDAGTANARRAEAAALWAIRDGFLRARLTESDVLSGQSATEHDAAMAAVGQALETMRDDAELYGSLRLAFDHYLAAFNSAAIRQEEAAPRNAAREVEVAMTDAGRALMATAEGQVAVVDAVYPRGWWMFGVIFAVLLSLTAGTGFRKARASAFGRSPMHRWALR